MSQHVDIHWVGIRKNSGRGSIWGWFTEVGKEHTPGHRNSYYEEPTPSCYIFWGSIGKKMHIEERELTYEFLNEVRLKSKNFKEEDPKKIIAQWGKIFDEEFSMYLLMLKIKG